MKPTKEMIEAAEAALSDYALNSESVGFTPMEWVLTVALSALPDGPQEMQKGLDAALSALRKLRENGAEVAKVIDSIYAVKNSLAAMPTPISTMYQVRYLAGNAAPPTSSQKEADNEYHQSVFRYGDARSMRLVKIVESEVRSHTPKPKSPEV